MARPQIALLFPAQYRVRIRPLIILRWKWESRKAGICCRRLRRRHMALGFPHVKRDAPRLMPSIAVCCQLVLTKRGAPPSLNAEQ